MRLTGSGSYRPYSPRAVLASFHASLMAHLDRPGPAKEVAQIFCQLMLLGQDRCEMLFTPRACQRICGRSWLP